MVEFPGVGQNFPKLEETLLKLAKNPLKIKKTTRQYKFSIWRTLQNIYILD